MKSYDPLRAPHPNEWQSSDEWDRIAVVMAYHRRAGVRLPNELLHATIHVVLENQVALGDEIPVRATLDRLMREGLDRHEALHAIGSILATHMQDLLQGRTRGPDPNEAYYEALKSLTAAKWRKEFE